MCCTVDILYQVRWLALVTVADHIIYNISGGGVADHIIYNIYQWWYLVTIPSKVAGTGGCVADHIIYNIYQWWYLVTK